MESGAKTVQMPMRNYQLDFLKFFFTICIFIYHARIFAEKNETLRLIANKWGWMGVHFFFVVSGLLMVNSYMCDKTNTVTDCGRNAGQFVLRKFAGIAPSYYTALLLNFLALLAVQVYAFREPFLTTVKTAVIKGIPELFDVQMAGVRPIGINAVTWYISAMLLSMLLQYYLLQKAPGFFMYVLSPLMALLLFGYFYSSGTPMFDQNEHIGIFTGGLLRAFCGISFGVVSWLLADALKRYVCFMIQRIALTIAELAVELLFAVVWFDRDSSARLLYPAMLLMPVFIAIIFSGKSYMAKLFRWNWMRRLGGASLMIYLNHFAARRIVEAFPFFERYTFWGKLGVMILLTAGFCLIYQLLLYVMSCFRRRMEQLKQQKIPAHSL